MSTVLQPVGPREPWVYWARRAVVVGVPLILILVLAFSCGGGGAKKKNTGKTAPKTHVTTSASVATTPTASTPPTACDPKTLTLTLSTDKDSYAPGETPKLIGTFKNPGTSDCSFTFAPANEDWLVKSGSAQIWSTSGCAVSHTDKTVTIKAGGHKKVSVIWDGHLQESKCAVGSTATAGTYTLSATLDGVAASTIHVFHIANPT